MFKHIMGVFVCGLPSLALSPFAHAQGSPSYSVHILYPVPVPNAVSPPGFGAGTMTVNQQNAATFWNRSRVATTLDPTLLPNTMESEGFATDGTYLVGSAGGPGPTGATVEQAFAWNPSTKMAWYLAPTGAQMSRAIDISGSQAVGWAKLRSTQLPQGAMHAMLWSVDGSSVTDLTPTSPPPGSKFAVPQAWANDTDGTHQVGYVNEFAAVWSGSASSFVNLAPTNMSFVGSEASAIHDDQIVGSGQDTSSTAAHALLWNGINTTPTDITPANVYDAWLTGTNGSQQIGFVRPKQFVNPDPAVWSGNGDSFVDLQQFMPSPGWLVTVDSIDQAGNIFAYGSDATGAFYNLEFSPVPEPSSFLLAGIGTLLVTARRRRRAIG